MDTDTYLTREITTLIEKYEKRRDGIEKSIEDFPDMKEALTNRKNVYVDVLMDLNGLLIGVKK